MDYPPETREEIKELDKRLNIALEVGAAILEMPDAFESIDNRRKLNARLANEQPDMFEGIMKIQGRLFKLVLEGR